MGATKLQWSVDGSFITDLSREWLWIEQKPYEKVKEFLLACMCGTNQTELELVELAHKVLLGKAKFTGNTGDGSFGLVADDTSVFDKYVKTLTYGVDSVYTERYMEVQLQNLMYVAKREEVEKMDCDSYGWLSPKGEFFDVPFGNHQGWAYDYVYENFAREEQIKTAALVEQRLKNADRDYDRFRMGDWLVYGKGWVLLHNTRHLEAEIERDPTRPFTKAQREFLFNYFTQQGRHREAYEVINIQED